MRYREGKEQEWQLGVSNNSDPYGRGVYRYAEQWANLMEQKLAEGRELENIADVTSHEADTEGITGFIYGCAVGILSLVWEHGEALRRWHNLKTQIQREGEEANKKGTVLNPALLK